VAPASFRTLIPFIAIDVVAEARALGSVWTVRSFTTNWTLPGVDPLALTADVALGTSETVGFDSNRAARRGIDDFDIAVFAV
jgi:hypothetical protein